MKIGDIVRLKSGGPKMTVLKPEDPTQVVCAWFVAGTHYPPPRQHFPVDALAIVSDEKPTEDADQA